MDEPDRVVLFCHYLWVDQLVLNPGMYEGEVDLASSYKRHNELLAKGSERLSVKRPCICLSQDVNAILALLNRSGDTRVFPGCS